MNERINKHLIPSLRLMSIITVIFCIVESYGKNNATFTIVQLFIGLLLIYIPEIINKILGWHFPDFLTLLYVFFIFCSVFLGTGLGFYGGISLWDKLLHFLSGGLLVGFGATLGQVLLPISFDDLKVSQFIILFSFCFSLTLGVFWEFYEFTFDGLLDLNMQRFATGNGVDLVGREALYDTMGDLIIDGIGAGLMVGYMFIEVRKDSSWLKNFKIKK